MLTGPVHRFVDFSRVARLATADAKGVPHLVPVCFAVAMSRVYITIDKKPKKAPGHAMKRIRNILENPAVAVLVDRYDDDWTQLGWVMMRGRAEILDDGPEHAAAQALLEARYLQLAAMRIETEPVIAITIERVTHWGNLDVGPAA